MRTKWPLMVLLFVIPGSALTYCSPDLISAAPPADPVVQAAGTAPAAAAVPQDGWQAMPYAGARSDANPVTPTIFHAPVVDELAPEAQAAKPAAPAAHVPSPCRKHLRTLHLPNKPVPKATGLLDRPATDKAAKADADKVVAILNQRIRKADECLERSERGG